MSNSATIVLLAKEVSDSWRSLLSSSGNFEKKEARLDTAFAKAEELGIRSEVYALANDMLHGKA